jgi:GGDEF domain-containing protein
MLDEEVFIERVGYNLARTRKQSTWFALLAVRLTRTSPDEALPDEIAERLSVEVARRLRGRLRLVDLTTKSSDGMIVVMLYEIREPQNGAQIAGRLIENLRQPFMYDDLEIVHEAVAGVVISAPEMDDPLRMFALARRTAKEAAGTGSRVLVAAGLDQE